MPPTARTAQMADKDAEIAELKAQVAGLQEQLEDATDTMSRLESMALQASMNASKQQKELVEALQRLEGMAMTAATGMAKFEKKTDERLGTCEGMLMQSAMNSSKWQKSMEDSASRPPPAATPFPFTTPFTRTHPDNDNARARIVDCGGDAHAGGDDGSEADYSPWEAGYAGRRRHPAGLRRQLRPPAAVGTAWSAGWGRGHARRGDVGKAEG